eukprot:scaffold5744_cov179-Ochromonas_danica.AAC.11
MRDVESNLASDEGVTIAMNEDDSYFNAVSEVLVEKLRENSLIKIALSNISERNESQLMLAILLTKHASSLQDLSQIMTASLISYLSSAGD